MWKKLALNPEQQTVNGQGNDRNNEQNQNDMLARAAALRYVDDVSQPAGLRAELDRFRQPDVSESQAIQQPQRVEHARQSQRHQHFENHLKTVGPQRVGSVDVLAADIADTACGIIYDKSHAGDEDEHHLLELADLEEGIGQRDER